ncbi:MAG: alpha/beta hydrolase [Chloroflexi bacterium]|nr:alpha/beta hydrolase [Chloroflexota bacterium]
MLRKRKSILIIVVIAALLALLAGGVVWLQPAAPMPQAIAALQTDTQVGVESDPWLTFRPRQAQPATGFIFYPGGLVDARAYAPAAHAMAAQGYLVVIVPMPLNLAFFGADRAEAVMRANPAIRRWAIGGHSLGGVAAALFVQSHPRAVDGLAFWAAYPSGDMSGAAVQVLSISGTRDGLSTPEKIAASRPQLPANTRWLAIEGGNHGQFGWYGAQSGDHDASISREEQQRQLVSAMVEWLQSMP